MDLLFATGIRVGEASALNIDDFDITELVFRVKGKGGRHRLAYVVDTQTVSIQLQYRQARSRIAADSPALFLNSSRQRSSTQGIANIIAQVRKDAGIERNITPHMLRHTVATLLLRNGVDIRVVHGFLGYASIATNAKIYARCQRAFDWRVAKESSGAWATNEGMSDTKPSTLFECPQATVFDPAKTHRARNSTRNGN